MVASSASIVSSHDLIRAPNADMDLGDVKEIEAHQEEIKEQKLLKLGFLRAELRPDGHPWSSS